MACLFTNHYKIQAYIPSYETKDKVTFYKIVIQVGSVFWSTSHRYNDFAELHQILVKDYCLSKDILPRKKILGNVDPAFIEKRRSELEQYIQSTINFLEKTLPKELINFLELEKYDINLIVKDFAKFCFSGGADYLSKSNNTYNFKPLQLYAISERFKQMRPVEESLDQECDFGHVLEFCSKLKRIIIYGSSSQINSSNLTHNQLAFGLDVFTSLRELFMYNCDIRKITGIGTLRKTLEVFFCNGSQLQLISGVLLCDQVHCEEVSLSSDPTYVWSTLVQLDISDNEINRIDQSIGLAYHLEKINLKSNQLECVNNFTSLTNIKSLNLSRNLIKDLRHFAIQLQSKLITELNLCENLITNLNGLDGLLNLQSLDLSSNFIFELSEINNISCLKKLTQLNLTGNPLTTIVDYRVQLLQKFIDRVDAIVLDNEKPTSKEIDCTKVFNALCLAKQLKMES